MFMLTVVDTMWAMRGMPQHNKLWTVCQLQARTAEPRVPETFMPQTEMCLSYSQGKLPGRHCVPFTDVLYWLLLHLCLLLLCDTLGPWGWRLLVTEGL